MKLIEIIATLIILTTSIFIIHGVPNDQLDTIEFGDVDVTQIKSLLLDLSSRVQHLEKNNDDLNIQVQSFNKKYQEVEKKNYEMLPIMIRFCVIIITKVTKILSRISKLLKFC